MMPIQFWFRPPTQAYEKWFRIFQLRLLDHPEKQQYSKSYRGRKPELKTKIPSQICREWYQWLKVILGKWDVSVHFLIPRSANRGRGKIENVTLEPSVWKIANYESYFMKIQRRHKSLRKLKKQDGAWCFCRTISLL